MSAPWTLPRGGRNRVNLVGVTVGAYRVIRRLPDVGEARYEIECSAGHRVICTLSCIRGMQLGRTRSTCTDCGLGIVEIRKCRGCDRELPLTDEHFYRTHKQGATFQKRCKQCDNDKGTRAAGVSSKELATRRQRICRLCCGLPWQRPVDGCPRCGGAHAEEPAVTIADALRMRNPSPREIV